MLNKWYSVTDTTVNFNVTAFSESVNNPLNAAIDAVNNIVENCPSPYNLMASGGIDSQAMIYAWKMSGHSFNIYTFRYNETYNLHDIEALFTFCEREKLDYTIVDFNYLKFLEEEYDSMARKYKCSSPQIAMHIKMACVVTEGTRIYAGNFLLPESATLTCPILGLYRFSETTEGKNTIPYFFLHTSELAYSFLTIEYSKAGQSYQNKINQYWTAGFPVIPQERKFNGFEKIKEYYDSHQYVLQDPKNRLKFSDKPSHRPFDWIFRHPYEELFGDKPLSFIINKPPLNIKNS